MTGKILRATDGQLGDPVAGGPDSASIPEIAHIGHDFYAAVPTYTPIAVVISMEC